MSNTYQGDSDENIHCIMLYQSMSGDASVGESVFNAEGGSIVSKAGDLFYITNTDCSISLKNVSLTLANDTFLRVEGNSSSRGWGTEGSNGGDVTLTADSQKIEGNILVDDKWLSFVCERQGSGLMDIFCEFLSKNGRRNEEIVRK